MPGGGTPSWFNTISAVQTEVAPLPVSPVAQSNLYGASSFAMANGSNPQSWPNLANSFSFESVYTGSIDITNSGIYTFGLAPTTAP